MHAAATQRLQGRERTAPGSPSFPHLAMQKVLGVQKQSGPDSSKSCLSARPEGADDVSPPHAPAHYGCSESHFPQPSLLSMLLSSSALPARHQPGGTAGTIPSGASVTFRGSRMRMRISSSSCARVFRGGGNGILPAWHKTRKRFDTTYSQRDRQGAVGSAGKLASGSQSNCWVCSCASELRNSQ